MEPGRCIYVVPHRLDGPSPPETLYALGARTLARMKGKDYGLLVKSGTQRNTQNWLFSLQPSKIGIDTLCDTTFETV